MDELTLGDFEENQNSIYAKIRGGWKEVLGKGIPVAELPEHIGYVVVLMYHDEEAELIERIGQQIDNIVPSIVQPKKLIHTGIAYKNGLELNNERSDYFCDIVRAMDKGIPVENFLFNLLPSKDSVMVEGHPNIYFVDLANQFQRLQEELALPEETRLGRQWGSHVTTNRFTGKGTPEDAAELSTLVANTPIIGRAVPKGIMVGYQTLSPEGYRIDPIEFFPF